MTAQSKHPRHRFFTAALLALLAPGMLVSCSSGTKKTASAPATKSVVQPAKQNPPSYRAAIDFELAAQRIKKGEGPAVAREIFAALPGIPPALHGKTAETLGLLPGELGRDSLIRLLKTKSPVLKTETRRSALNLLVQRKEKGAGEFALRTIREEHALFTQLPEKTLIARDLKDTPQVFTEIIMANPARLTAPIANYLIRKKHAPAMALLRAAVKNRKLSAEEVKLPKTPEELAREKKEREERERREEAARLKKEREEAAAQKKKDAKRLKELEEALIATAKERGDPDRVRALKTLLQSGEKRLVQIAREILQNALQQYEKEEKPVVHLAMEKAPALPPRALTVRHLKIIYGKSGDQDYKTRALNALVQTEKSDPYLMARELRYSLVAAQAGLSLYSLRVERSRSSARKTAARSRARTRRKRTRRSPLYEPRERKIVVGPVKRRVSRRSRRRYRPGRTARRAPTKQKRTRVQTARGSGRIKLRGAYPRTSAAYRRSLHSYFRKSLGGAAESRKMMARINNALQSYAESSSPTARFFMRAYRREFILDENEKARELMRRGISHPGSLNAVLRNVHLEYSGRSMRVYALSRFFALSSFEAEILLNFIRR